MKNVVILLICMVYLTTMSCKHNSEHTHVDQDHDQETTEHEHTEAEHNDEYVVSEDHNHQEVGEHVHEESEIADHDQESEDEYEHEHEYKTAKVAFESFYSIIKTSGEILALNSDEIIITAPSAGIVHYADQKITEGATVYPEQPVFYISGGNLTDNNVNLKYNRIKATYDKAKSDYDRAEQLVKQNIISEKEFDQTKMVYLNAKSEFDIIKKSASGKSSVNAPSKSFIKEFYVEEGQYVEAGEKLACVIKNHKLKLVAEVSQKYFSGLSSIESATFIPAGSSKTYDTKELNGKILSYGKAINSNSYYLPVVFEIDYHKELVPGSFAQIFLKGKKTDKCIIVPKTALVEEQGNYFVFVEEGHDTFHKHPVTLGDEDGRHVVVLEGLKGDEVIVTEGTYFVKLASMSSNLPAHSHSH